MCKQLFKSSHARRHNIGKIMFLIKFQQYFEKMYRCSRALRQVAALTIDKLFFPDTVSSNKLV